MREFGGSGFGPSWDGSRPRLGPGRGLLYNLCTTMCSCFYVFCCCWLIEDCFMGRRSLPRPAFGSPLYGSPEAPPPPPPHIAPEPYGLFGSTSGPPGPPRQPGPMGYPGEPLPF